MFFSVAVQGVAVLLVAASQSVIVAPPAGWAALYGGAASWINTGLLIWRHRQGERGLHGDAARHLRSFYRSSLERFIAVGAWLALGLGGLALDAVSMLTGFVVGLLAWVIAMAGRARV